MFDLDCDYPCSSDTIHKIDWYRLICDPPIGTSQIHHQDYCNGNSELFPWYAAYPMPLVHWFLWDDQHLQGQFKSIIHGVGEYNVSFGDGEAIVRFTRFDFPFDFITIEKEIWHIESSFSDMTATGKIDIEELFWGFCLEDDPLVWRAIGRISIFGEDTFSCRLLLEGIASKLWTRECAASLMIDNNRCHYPSAPTSSNLGIAANRAVSIPAER
jgi:hypothetical protein